MIYPDTGCLVKFYNPEPDSDVVIAAAGNRPMSFTALHSLEMISALQGKRFRNEATEQQIDSTLAFLEQDQEASRLVSTAVDWPEAFGAATNLARLHGDSVGTRSLDTLHIAVAIQLGAEALLTTDARQKTLAGIVGATNLT